MKKEEFYKLFEEYNKTKSKQSLDKIFDALIPLVCYIVKEDYNDKDIELRKELKSIGFELIFKTLETYDYKKGYIVPYFSQRLHWEYNKYLTRKEYKWDNIVRLDEELIDEDDLKLIDLIYDKEELSVEETVEHHIELNKNKKLLYEAFTYLTPMELEIIKYRYGFINDKIYSYAAIAQILGYESHAFMIRLEKRALEKMKKYLSGKPMSFDDIRTKELNKYLNMSKEEKETYLKTFNKKAIPVLSLYLGLQEKAIFNPKDIAEILELNPSNVNSILTRFRKKIMDER